MTTAKQILANRRNGVLSRGPKTARGKAKSSKNALRHGLSIKAARDPALARQIEQLAQALTDPSGVHFAQAMLAAEAEVEMNRIKAARAELINQQFFSARCGGTTLDDWVRIERLERYERRGFTRLKRALRSIIDENGQKQFTT